MQSCVSCTHTWGLTAAMHSLGLRIRGWRKSVGSSPQSSAGALAYADSSLGRRSSGPELSGLTCGKLGRSGSVGGALSPAVNSGVRGRKMYVIDITGEDENTRESKETCSPISHPCSHLHLHSGHKNMSTNLRKIIQNYIYFIYQ
jgi:hypothetical protein